MSSVVILSVIFGCGNERGVESLRDRECQWHLFPGPDREVALALVIEKHADLRRSLGRNLRRRRRWWRGHARGSRGGDVLELGVRLALEVTDLGLDYGRRG